MIQIPASENPFDSSEKESINPNAIEPEKKIITGSQLPHQLVSLSHYYKLVKDSTNGSSEPQLDLLQYERIRGPLKSNEDGQYILPVFLYHKYSAILLGQGIMELRNNKLNFLGSAILSEQGILAYDIKYLSEKGYNKDSLKLVSIYSPILDAGEIKDIFKPQHITNKNYFEQFKPLKTTYKEVITEDEVYNYIPESLDLSHRPFFCAINKTASKIKIVHQPLKIPFHNKMPHKAGTSWEYAMIRIANGTMYMGIVHFEKTGFILDVILLKYHGYASIYDPDCNLSSEGISDIKNIFPLRIILFTSIIFNRTSFKPIFSVVFDLPDNDLDKWNNELAKEIIER
jgi:hypothetical protein